MQKKGDFCENMLSLTTINLYLNLCLKATLNNLAPPIGGIKYDTIVDSNASAKLQSDKNLLLLHKFLLRQRFPGQDILIFLCKFNFSSKTYFFLQS